MSVEQSTPETTADSPSILDRLGAALVPDQPEAAAEQPEQADNVETTDDDSQPEAVAEEFAEVTADDGSAVKVPAKLKDSFLRWDDYTKKTQAVQAQAEKAQDQLAFAEAQQQVLAAVAQDIGQYHATETQLKRYDSLDWSALYSADPGQAMRLRDERDQLRAQLGQIGEAIKGKAAHAKNAAEQHMSWQWQKAEEGVMRILGKVTPEENQAMAQTAKALGFTEKELKGRFADAKILHAIYKAAKWDQLQASKSGALNGIKAPPILKPGATQGNQPLAEKRYKDARTELKKTGSVNAAAKALLRLG